ncbi:hypothetical protein BT69DRAFT_370544 [Atractiella rhizophila]|nr:hypothetical protein BT69DRAFT_370544 [Atractiella rhizophila]
MKTSCRCTSNSCPSSSRLPCSDLRTPNSSSSTPPAILSPISPSVDALAALPSPTSSESSLFPTGLSEQPNDPNRSHDQSNPQDLLSSIKQAYEGVQRQEEETHVLDFMSCFEFQR